MNVVARQSLSALGFFVLIVALLGGAVSAAVGVNEEQASVAALTGQAQALEARTRRIQRSITAQASASAFIDAPTITLAGAAIQQRVESAVTSAAGRLASSKVEVGGRGSEKRVALEAELTITQPKMQKLLYDLETGRPYLFVESFEARAPEKSDGPADMRMSLTVSGQWGGAK